MVFKKTADFNAAVQFIVAEHGIVGLPYTVQMVAAEEQKDANEAFAADPALMSRYIDHLAAGGQDETYTVDSGDAHLGTILVFYVNEEVEVYHT